MKCHPGSILLMACASALLSLASCDSDSSTDPSSQTAGTWNKKDYGIPWNTSINYGTFTDVRDGQVYRTVTIGKQTWMAENLNYQVDSSWCYENSVDSCAKYGRLYQWAAMMGLDPSHNENDWTEFLPHQGVCPSGWHIPSAEDWDTLGINADGGNDDAGTRLKSKNGWSYDSSSTDVYGFRGLPAGERNYLVEFKYVGNGAYFWSYSEIGVSRALDRILSSGGNGLGSEYFGNVKNAGLSIRCLKDDPTK